MCTNRHTVTDFCVPGAAVALHRAGSIFREFRYPRALAAIQKRADNEVCPACRDKLVFYDKLHTTYGDRFGR